MKTLYLIVAISVLSVAVGGLLLDRKNVHARTVSTISKKTEKIVAKARKARADARAPGAVERLRKSNCRDC